jgi:hypothetical protein
MSWLLLLDRTFLKLGSTFSLHLFLSIVLEAAGDTALVLEWSAGYSTILAIRGDWEPCQSHGTLEYLPSGCQLELFLANYLLFAYGSIKLCRISKTVCEV